MSDERPVQAGRLLSRSKRDGGTLQQSAYRAIDQATFLQGSIQHLFTMLDLLGVKPLNNPVFLIQQ